MTERNVEIVRRVLESVPDTLPAIDRVGRGPMTDPGQFAELFHPDFELLPAQQSLLAGSTYRGLEGSRRFWRDLLSTWQEYRVEPVDLIDVDARRVAVVTRIKASTRDIEIDETWSSLWTLRDGKIVRFEGFDTPDGALRAAGDSGAA